MDVAINLKILAKRLEDPRLPRQKVMAEALKVDQGFISHVRNNDVARVTDRIIRLAEYVDKCLDPERPVREAVDGYLARGGDASLLVQQVAILEAAQRIAQPAPTKASKSNRNG